MNREEFCSILETEYHSASEEWFDTTQQFGPPGLVWNWLNIAETEVPDHHKLIIKFLQSIYLQKFQRLKDRLDYLTERKDQLLRAISILSSPHQPYYHLSHFEEDEYSQYYTDGIEPKEYYGSYGDY